VDECDEIATGVIDSRRHCDFHAEVARQLHQHGRAGLLAELLDQRYGAIRRAVVDVYDLIRGVA